LIPVMILFLWFLSSNRAESQGILIRQEDIEGHPKIESSLYQLREEYSSRGTAGSQEFAKTSGIDMDQEEKVVVFLLLEVGNTKGSIDIEHLRLLGCDVLKSGDSVIKARVPINLFEYIADKVEGVSFIKALPTFLQVV
jgi:hypothetical protein